MALSKEPITLDMILRMRGSILAKRDSVLTDLYAGIPTITRLRCDERVYRPQVLPAYAAPMFGGVRLRESPMFPYEFQCDKCGGSGEGETSTYCQKCVGAGRVRIEGMMTNDVSRDVFYLGNDSKAMHTVLLTAKLPKKFPIRWPRDVLVPKRPVGVL